MISELSSYLLLNVELPTKSKIAVLSSNLGRVAENRRVCLLSGSLFIVSIRCSWNPISKSLSASSNTMYSTLDNFIFISTTTCMNRPGVAIRLWESGVYSRKWGFTVGGGVYSRKWGLQ